MMVALISYIIFVLVNYLLCYYEDTLSFELFYQYFCFKVMKC